MDNQLACLPPVDGKNLGVTMTAEIRSKPLTILDLSRETRDKIWGYVVVFPKIYVSGIKGYRKPSSYQPPGRLEYRMTNLSHTNVAPPRRSEHPDLSIFLACRQIYEEAMRVYYSKNNFVFYLDDDGYNLSDVCRAQAFLQDRPAPALQYIRQIEMDIVDFSSRGRFQDDFIDSYADFVKFITCHVRIEHLTLNIHVMCLNRLFASFSHWKHMVELCNIPKVQRLTIRLDTYCGQCESHVESSCFNADNMCGIAAGIIRGVEAMEHLRSEMLDNGANLGRKMIRTTMVSIPDHDPLYQSRTTVLLFEVDNNSGGECLLPTLDDAGYANTYDVALFELGPDALNIMNNFDEQQYAELQRAAHKFGEELHGYDLDQYQPEDETDDDFEDVLEDGVADEFEHQFMDDLEDETDDGLDNGLDDGLDNGLDNGLDKGLEDGIEGGFEGGFDREFEYGFDSEGGFEVGFEDEEDSDAGDTQEPGNFTGDGMGL